MSLTDALDADLQLFAARGQLLICLDFDGCVAELVADAHLARPVPANAEAVERLAALEDVEVAYVSGRPLQTLQDLAAAPQGTLFIGSHGAERSLGTDNPALTLTADQQAAHTHVVDTLERIAADHDGAWVEHKPAGAAIHVRHIDDGDRAESVLSQARTALETADEVHLKDGKKILEAVVVHATKGEAIEELRALRQPEAVFFAGDDVTDEHGFAVLGDGDIGLKVGPGETLAAHRIGTPSDLAEVLHRIAELRTAG